MAANFHILIHHNENYLHLKLYGDFDAQAAWKLLTLLKHKDLERCRIIIHTSSLQEIDPAGINLFKERCEEVCGSSAALTFTGENAACLAPQKI